MTRHRVHINAEWREVDAPPGTSLLSVLRDDLGLTGTHYGCGHGACGSCVVLVGDVARPSCTLTVEDVADQHITTIEGLAPPGTLHPVQQSFIDADAMQCGYCTSGLILGAVALLRHTADPGDAEIREALSSHLCRCGVYGRVIRAVRLAAARQTT